MGTLLKLMTICKQGFTAVRGRISFHSHHPLYRWERIRKRGKCFCSRSVIEMTEPSFSCPGPSTQPPLHLPQSPHAHSHCHLHISPSLKWEQLGQACKAPASSNSRDMSNSQVPCDSRVAAGGMPLLYFRTRKFQSLNNSSHHSPSRQIEIHQSSTDRMGVRIHGPRPGDQKTSKWGKAAECKHFVLLWMPWMTFPPYTQPRELWSPAVAPVFRKHSCVHAHLFILFLEFSPYSLHL